MLKIIGGGENQTSGRCIVIQSSGCLNSMIQNKIFKKKMDVIYLGLAEGIAYSVVMTRLS